MTAELNLNKQKNERLTAELNRNQQKNQSAIKQLDDNNKSLTESLNLSKQQLSKAKFMGVVASITLIALGITCLAKMKGFSNKTLPLALGIVAITFGVIIAAIGCAILCNTNLDHITVDTLERKNPEK